MSQQKKEREHWNSKIGFILAAAGSAIGLGNIWKFPYIVGENGGAAFIIVYLICVTFIGLPVILSEIIIGRTTQLNPVGSFKKLTKSRYWPLVGGMGILAGFIILSFYGVVAGWSTGYIIEAIRGSFYDFPTPDSAGHHFAELTQNVWWIVGWFAVFIALTTTIVYFGIKKGIELGSKILMPLLFIILFILMINGLTLDGAGEGLKFLFHPDWSKINGEIILEALGQAFFTLSLGMGAMLTYGSYMSKKDNVPTSSFEIVVLDTLIAIIAGIAIFTAVFSTGQSAAAGPGLIFHTLPVVFTKMTGGYFFSIIFFILLAIAALTSTISLLEVVTAYFVDEKNWPRHKAVLVLGFVTFLIGVPSALSFNLLSDFHLFGMNFFDLANYFSSNILLPFGGLMISIFIGWVWGVENAIKELHSGAENLFEKAPWLISLWKFLIKFIAPVFIFLIFINSIGLLDVILKLFN